MIIIRKNLFNIVFVLSVAFDVIFCGADECTFCKIYTNADCKTPQHYVKDFHGQILQYIDPPFLHCVEHDLLHLNWKAEGGNAYFLEIFDTKQNDTKYSPLIACSYYTVKGLSQDTHYKIKLWSVSIENGSIISFSKNLYVKTPIMNAPRKPVKNFGLKHFTLVGNAYDALIQWTTSEDRNCYFDIVWFGDEDLSGFRQIQFTDPAHRHEILLKNLTLGSNNSVAIMAISEENRMESNKTWLHFSVPTCLESFKSLDICAPATPENFTVQETLVDFVDDKAIYDISVKWEQPNYTPDLYILHLVSIRDNKASSSYFNISGEATETILRSVEIGSSYQVSLKARSKAGFSLSAYKFKMLNGHAGLKPKSSWTKLKITLAIVCPIIAIMVGLLLVIVFNHYFVKRIKPEPTCQYFKELEGTVGVPAEEYVLQVTDEWELNPEKLTFQAVLGEGAFGIVRRACLETDETNKVEVAIKMLKDSPSPEDLKEFHREIEIMKMVGTHPHLVSMIGCITTNSHLPPLLIVEYCAKGDLQSFLRNIWEKITNQAGENEVRYVNQQGMHFDNKLYDIDKVFGDEFNIKPIDLMSFARQVSMGMEYLSSLRVLHRDLAARNILVCEDCRTIKISDFGLSRDVYQNSVYCKSGAGKLPLRWMALESMTHQKYTTFSDVWSFGILLWEIVTLGGNPYPGVNTHDLLPLLKQGYRMERPVNCSQELYAIMINCWQEHPKDRPTFAELVRTLESLLEKDAHYINMEL